MLLDIFVQKIWRKISILGAKTRRSEKAKCPIVMSTLKVYITIVLLYFLIFYLLAPIIEIWLKYFLDNFFSKTAIMRLKNRAKYVLSRHVKSQRANH